MKDKKEKKLTEDGNEMKQAVENEKNNNAQNEAQEENPESKTVDATSWIPFIQKFIKVMIAIEDLMEAKQTMEQDYNFVELMKKFMEFKKKYDEEHPMEKEEVNDDYECEDEELYDMVKAMKENLKAHGIQVKVRKVTDPEEVKKFENFMNGTQKNGATKTYDA